MAMATETAAKQATRGASRFVTRPVIDALAVDETDGLTSRVQILKDRLLEAQSQVCADRAHYVTESFLQTEGESLVRRRAKGFAHVFAKMPVAIRDGELRWRPAHKGPASPLRVVGGRDPDPPCT